MFKPYHRAGILFFSLVLMCLAFVTEAMQTIVVKKETSEYLLDLKYPQGFPSEEVNKAIKDAIKETRKQFMSEIIDDAGVPDDAPGKTGLTITFSLPYDLNNALSVQINSSIYHRGAAHPSNSVTLLNFVKGRQVTLADVFKPGTNYLKPIADFCHKAITAKDISDADVIKEGTAPTVDNYRNWYFTPKGIDIVFNTYQVAAYVFGEQTVSIPLSLISSQVKPELSKMLWGN